MSKRFTMIMTILSIAVTSQTLSASPTADLKTFRNYFKKLFPTITLNSLKDGVYALDSDRKAAWKDDEDFAPAYTDAIELGEKLFKTKFKNGKTFASCFKNKGKGIRHLFPYFSKKRGKVITIEAAINECRTKNGEKKWKWAKGKLAAVSAYMSKSSRGKTLAMKIDPDPRSLAIYERGKRHFYAKRGQLNFSCADCHVYNAGKRLRAEILSPALGHVTHFPVWRKKWAKSSEGKGKTGPTRGLGTLHRRYAGCNKNIRAKPFKPQSDEYTALEYFHAYMSRGLKFNGPAMRP